MIHTEEPERFMQLTLVGMANHRREGFVGALGALIEGLGEAAPSSSPFDWGEEDEVSRRLGPAASTIRITPRAHVWTFASLDEGWDLWERTNGPLNAMRQLLETEALAALPQRGRALMCEMDEATDGGLVLRWHRLEITGRAPSAPAL
jgi:hypothetical protein